MDCARSLGYSPCPNDTFIFFALANGLLDASSTTPFDVHLADVEVLNQKAGKGELDITKVSTYAVLDLLDEYWLLRAGGAIGRGCGPLVVSRQEMALEQFRGCSLAIPGRMTTAHLLLELNGEFQGRCVEMRFDHIMPAVVAGEVDAGLIIHEGRFTYPSLGLKLVLDLGAWWEDKTGLPLPLGVILIKRRFGASVAARVEEKIRDSLLYARKHEDQAWRYVSSLAQEMEPVVIRQHIEMFVNDYSFDIGSDGENAIRFMLAVAAEQHNRKLPEKPIFWNDNI